MSDQPSDSMPAPATLTRRGMLWLTSRTLMGAGLAGGYGLFAWIGVRFMLPARGDRVHRLFVSQLDRVGVGSTLLYMTPDGRTVNITRRAAAGGVDDFVALSSTCPHLGCQVRWEGQNDRYFCPCHNGTFDASGKATGGPPGDAGLALPRYALAAEAGLLYILVPAEQLSMPPRQARVLKTYGPAAPLASACRGCRSPAGGPPSAAEQKA
jgi:nitrite reductase/ring-hydroxylating ferredoxin subunit